MPEHNDNVSHEHPFKEFVILAVGLSVVVAVIFVVLGLLVDFAVDKVTPELEAKLFSGMSFEQVPLTDDDPMQAQLQTLTDGLMACMDVGYPVRVQVAESDEVNAFAFVGGKIVVYRGLLDAVNTESGLAFVLAHELAHFIHRDHLRGMGRGLVLATLSALMTGADSGISQLLAPAQSIGMARFSRQQESAADAAALKALNCRYGEVTGATELFEVLQASKGESEFKLAYLLASHPSLGDRIAELNKLATELGYRSKD